MGVQGLTSFVDDNHHLLTDHKLHDSKLVIDGSNLYHFIYYRFKVSHHYGGDYDTFAKCIKLFFDCLQSCNVTPFVVFDGGYEKSDRKLKTVLGRLSERVRQAACAASGHGSNVMPLLASETFKHSLDFLGISHITCDGEADEEIAALANYWNCPVLSNDSDFFVFPLSSGFVLLDYLNFTIRENKHDGTSVKYLEGQIFHQKTLLKSVNCFDSTILPLFATLLGNDYVDPKVFEPFFASVKLPKGEHSKFFKSQRHSRKLGLLLWLADKDTSEVAIEAVLSYFKKDQKEKLKQVILASIQSYVNPKSTSLSYILEETSGQNESEFLSYTGKTLPHWFSNLVREGKISSKVLNAVRLHRMINMCQIEIVSQPSSYNCSLRLRQILYGILLSVEDFPSDSQSRLHIVEEWGRDGLSSKASKVDPVYDIKGESIKFGDIPSVSEQKRRCFILNCVNVSECEEDSVTLALLALIYWANNADPKINSVHIIVMISCIFKLAVFEHISQSHESDPGCNPTVESTIYSKAQENLERFSEPPKHDKSKKFDCNIIHAFSQFQTCLQAVLHLNNLLLCPFKDIAPSLVFNGSFAYNLFRELKSRRDPKLYICELLGRSTLYSRKFEQMHDFVCKQIQDITPAQVQLSHKKEKKLMNKLAKKQKIRSELLEGEENTENARERDVFCDANNRFSGLLLE